jgi:hypothetical protein
MLKRLRQWVLNRFWYVCQRQTLLVQGQPERVIALLQASSKPKHDQLHLQDLFVGGRRYHIQPWRGGAALLTSSKTYWRYTESLFRNPRRTRAVARVIAQTSPLQDDLTRLQLSGHIRAGYLLDVIWIPLFFSLIFGALPLPLFRVVIIVVIFGLSYGYHYYQAAYQANEIIYFVNKVLAPHRVDHLPELATAPDDTLYMNDSFQAEWERFYQAHREEG